MCVCVCVCVCVCIYIFGFEYRHRHRIFIERTIHSACIHSKLAIIHHSYLDPGEGAHRPLATWSHITLINDKDSDTNLDRGYTSCLLATRPQNVTLSSTMNSLIIFFVFIVCFTSYFMFSIAVLLHSLGVVYYHLLLR